MWREIRWTDESEAHIARHDVTPDEVEQLINTRPRLISDGRDDSTYVFGTTDAGRHMLVVLAPSADGRFFVVTTRDMTARERRTFQRKAR